MTASQPHTTQDLEKRARKRAMAKFGWYHHAFIFLLVNAGLSMAALATGRHWHWFPLLGWGLGLAIHGLVVFSGLSASPLRERLIEQERRKLQANDA